MRNQRKNRIRLFQGEGWIGFLFILVLTVPVFAQTTPESLFSTFKVYDNVLVERILSANTFTIEGREKIRMIGLKAPDVPRNKRLNERREETETTKGQFLSTSPVYFSKKGIDPTTHIGERAYNFTKKLLEGHRVRLEFDVQSKDDDFTTLAYVFLENGTFVNEEILKQGFAALKILPPNTKYADRLRKAYKEARKEKRGIHGE